MPTTRSSCLVTQPNSTQAIYTVLGRLFCSALAAESLRLGILALLALHGVR